MRQAPFRAPKTYPLLIALALALAGCRPAAAPSDEDSAPASHPVMLVTAARAEIVPMEEQLHLLGKTVATHHVIIRAPTTGRVMGLNLVTGDWVNKGQIVAHIINREIEAAEDGLVVAQRIDPDSAQHLAHSVNRYTHSPGIPVRAPDSGIVSQPPVTSGQVVADLDSLVDLIDPRSLYVEANVPVSQLHALKPGMLATVFSPLFPGKPFASRVAAMLPNFDTATASSTVRLDFTGSERILEAGSPVTAQIVINSSPNALAVPTAALFQEPGPDHFHIFVIGSDHRVHRTEVGVGIRERTRVQITTGLNVGDLVVTSGGYAISDGLQVAVAQGAR
jgi:membrane fusion protein, multidrug efflux system